MPVTTRAVRPYPADAILLVEDSADDVTLTRWAFAKAGITTPIVVARDGVEALDLLLPGDGRPALCPAIVLLDLNMPRMGGLELLARLRAQTPTRLLPVIILTSSADDADVLDGYGLGANSYIQKPVSTEEFAKAAAALGVYWLTVNTTRPSPEPE